MPIRSWNARTFLNEFLITRIFEKIFLEISVPFDFHHGISGNFRLKGSLVWNSTISGFSGTFPRKFPYHLSRFENFEILRRMVSAPCELLGAPWVKKLHYIFFTFTKFCVLWRTWTTTTNFSYFYLELNVLGAYSARRQVFITTDTLNSSNKYEILE